MAALEQTTTRPKTEVETKFIDHEVALKGWWTVYMGPIVYKDNWVNIYRLGVANGTNIFRFLRHISCLSFWFWNMFHIGKYDV